jgi:ketosteroid isomerase-like protein
MNLGMNRIILKLSIMLAVVACARVSTLEPPTSRDNALFARESEWVQALVKRDTAALAELLDTSFVLTTSAPHLIARATYLEEAGRFERTIEDLSLRDRRLRRYGAAAVTTGEATIVGTNAGVPFGMVVRYSNVFVRQQGTWRAVSSQTTIEDYDPTGGKGGKAEAASDQSVQARDSTCTNLVASPARPVWRDCVRYGGGPSVGAPPSDYTGERPPSQWCLDATGRPPGDFGVTGMNWIQASRSWLSQVLSDTTDHGEGWRSVLGGAPRLTEADSINQITDEATCNEIAEVLNRDLLGWDVGPPPVVVFRVRDYLIAFPSNARLGEFGMAAGMGLDRRIRGVASW